MPSIATDSLEGTSGSDRGSDDRDIVLVSSAVGDTSSSPPLVRIIEMNGAQSLVVPAPVPKISFGCPGSDVQGVMFKDDLQASTKDAVLRECARGPNGIGINGCAGDCQGPRGEQNKAAGEGAGDSQQGVTENPTVVVDAGSAGEAAAGGEGEGEDLLQDMRALTSKITVDTLLRPRSQELLDAVRERAPRYIESLRELRQAAQEVKEQVLALRRSPAILAIAQRSNPPPPQGDANEQAAGGGGEEEEGEDSDWLEDWVDGLLESMCMQAHVQTSRAADLEAELQHEIQEREALVEHYSGPQCLVAKPGEVSEEQHWEMLGERLKLYGASRLAEMFRSIASSADGGSRCRSESSVLSVGDDDEEEDEEEEGNLDNEENEEGEEGQLEEASTTADWEDQTTASAVEAREGAIEAMLQQVETQSRRVQGLQKELRDGEEQAAACLAEMEQLQHRLPPVEEGVEVLVSSLRRYGAFRLASLARGYKRRRLQSAWLRWHAVLLRQAMPQLAPPLPEIAEVEQPPWLNKGLGSEAEDALAAVHSRLQEVVHRLRALGEEVEGQVREREDLLQDVGEQGEDPEARLRILLLDVDEEEDEEDPSAAAAFRRAVKALLARAKGLAQKMVKDMFRELEHQGGAEQLLLLAGNATDDQASASSTPGATTPSASLLLSPRPSLAPSALPPPPLLVGSDDTLPCDPARPWRLVPLLPPLSSPHATSSPPSQHLPAKPPSLPPIAAKSASPPPPSPASLAQRQKQLEDAERCAREEGLMEAVRQRLATQGECVEDLEHQLQEQQTQLHMLKRRLDSMHRVVAQCPPPPPEGPPTAEASNGPSNGPPREGSRQEKLASRVKLFAAARLAGVSHSLERRGVGRSFAWWQELSRLEILEHGPPSTQRQIEQSEKEERAHMAAEDALQGIGDAEGEASGS